MTTRSIWMRAAVPLCSPARRRSRSLVITRSSRRAELACTDSHDSSATAARTTEATMGSTR